MSKELTMKKLGLIAILLTASQVWSQGIVLPPDAVAQLPAETMPSEAKIFSGRWEGKWDERMPHVLVVEEIKSATEAVVLYAWQDPPVANAWGGGWIRTTATIDGNTLRVPLRNGTKAWYEYLPDGNLKAGYLRPTSTSQSNAVLRKVQP
jgi:hypothetical protein